MAVQGSGGKALVPGDALMILNLPREVFLFRFRRIVYRLLGFSPQYITLVMTLHRNFTYWIDKRRWKYVFLLTTLALSVN